MSIRFQSHQHRVLVTGDDANENISISRDAGGQLFDNGEAIDGATASNTATIVVHGGDGNDVITLVDSTGSPLPGAELLGGDGNDTLTGGSGNDVISGQDGNDTLFGHAGNDTLYGGDGNDFVDGDQGTDTAFLGAGNDVFRWDNGDGSDRVDGGSGFDEMLFNGNTAAIAEQFTLTSSDDGHALFTRVQGSIVMDLTDIEKVTLNPFGGADTITINDPSGTGITDIDLNLGFDGSNDTININDDDNVSVVDNGNGNLTILGVSGATVPVTGFEATHDHIFINGQLFI